MTSYDTVPYPLLAHAQTHPAALATLALLHGLKPAPVEGCRVLELGCASGSNLIPFACQLGASQFVGIDRSRRQIEQGRDFVQALGLTNIRLEAMDLLDVDASLGTFDYIIAHGLYSWVPQQVRDRLLALVQQHLSESGVAFVSFNAYPGWQGLSTVRDLMLYHTRQTSDPLAKAGQAGELLQAVVEALSASSRGDSDPAYAHVSAYRAVADNLQRNDSTYLVHDILEEVNQPIYFHAFVEHARAHGLQYVADVNFRTHLNVNLPGPFARFVDSLTHDPLEREQYLDFLSNRPFRQVLLCRAGPETGFALDLETLRRLQFASSARAEPGPDQVTFVGADGARHTVEDPVTQAAWQYLIDRWPQSAAFDDLLAQAYAGRGVDVPPAETLVADGQLLAVHLIRAFLASPRLVEFTVCPPRFSPRLSQRPVASAWARLQAAHDARITTLRHARHDLNTVERFILQRLDGSHTPGEIVEQLMTELFDDGQLEMPDGERITDPGQVHAMLSQVVDQALSLFARLPVLVA